MIPGYTCDMCGAILTAHEVNIISFFPRDTESNEPDKVLVASPRLFVCDACFAFLKEVVKQAQTVTIDDIEKEA